MSWLNESYWNNVNIKKTNNENGKKCSEGITLTYAQCMYMCNIKAKILWTTNGHLKNEGQEWETGQAKGRAVMERGG
jgi:hypothetical protein